MTFRLMARLIATAMLLLTLTSCHIIVLYPCLVMSCSTTITSIPPRNDPFARALGKEPDLKTVLDFLAVVSRTQYEALNRRWPTEPLCAQVAAVGCRYSIPVEIREYDSALRPEHPSGCALLDVAVVDGPAGRIDVRQLSYRAMQCPPKPVTPDGASTPAASSGGRLP